MSEYEIELYRIIGEMIREKRSTQELTLEQVANKLGVIPKTLQRYETGERKIKISSIMALADILDFDYNKFMADAKRKLANDNIEDYNVVAESPNYYLNIGTRDQAQSMFDDSEMRMLFDLKKSSKGKELMAYAKFLKEQHDRENNH